MAPRGRPPKPTEQKRRTGNPGKRALPKLATVTALEPANGVPPVPISLGEGGRQMWTAVWTSAAKAWLSPEVDSIRVATVCQLMDDIGNYQRVIAESSPILREPIVTPAGAVVGHHIVANPLVKMRNDALKLLDRELSALGFDPTSRARLGLAEIKARTALDRYLNDGSEEGPEAATGEDFIDIAADDVQA